MLLFLTPLFGKAQSFSVFPNGSEPPVPLIGKHKPANMVINSQEFQQVNGTINGQLWFYSKDSLAINAPVTFKTPQGWTGSATFSTTQFMPNDSLLVNFTLTYPQANLPYYPQEFSLEVRTDVDGYVATSVGKVYFTPYNTVELWDKTDFEAQKRVWHVPNHTPTRLYVAKNTIPMSDITAADTLGGFYLEDIPTRLVRIAGLAYNIPMKALPNPNNIEDDGLDSLAQEEGARGQKRLCSRDFSGTISGRLVSPIVNDMGRNVEIPLSGILVKLKESDWGLDEVFGEVHTDAQGYFSIFYNRKQSCFEGKQIELYLEFKAKNKNYDIRCVVGFGGIFDNVYSEEHNLGSHGQNYNFDKKIIVQPRAFRLVNWAVRGWEYTQNVGGYSLHKDLKIQVEKNSSHFFPWTAWGIGNPLIKPSILIEGADADQEATMYHEFGHFLMWNLQNRNHIVGDGVGSSHRWSQEYKLGLAWSEGWAGAMEMILDAAHHWEDQEYACERNVRWYELRERGWDDLQRGFYSEYFVACALYDLWDGASKQLPPTVLRPNGTVVYVGTNDFTNLEVPTDTWLLRDWSDESEFSFRDILTPIVQRGGSSNKLKDITEYFAQFRDHVIPTHDCHKKWMLSRAFEANQVNAQRNETPLFSFWPLYIPTGKEKVNSGTLSADAIFVMHSETHHGGSTWSARVNPNWADYFQQTRTISATSPNFNPHIFENLDVFGNPNINPSRIILAGSQAPSYVTCADPQLRFRHSNLELFPNTTLEMNGISFLDIQEGARLWLYAGSKLVLKRGASLHIAATATLQMAANAEIIVEEGAYICIEQGAIFNIDASAQITIQNGSHTGINPALGLPPATNCTRFIKYNDAIFAYRMPYVELDNSANTFNFGLNDFTMEFHVNLYGQSINRALISTRVPNTTDGYVFGIDEGKPYLQFGDGTLIGFVPIDPTFANLNLADENCHHVAIKRTNGRIYFYADGQLVGTGSAGSSYPVMGAPWLVNDRISMDNGFTLPFVGWMGEARFWNYAVPDATIAANYGLPITNFPAGLVAHYLFEEDYTEQVIANRIGGYAHGWCGNNPLGADEFDPERGKIEDVGCNINGLFRANEPTPPAVQTLEEVKAYPNPFEESFTIEIPKAYIHAKVELLNLQGMTLETKILSSGTHVWTPRTALPKGLYIIRVVADNQMTTLRIVKQ